MLHRDFQTVTAQERFEVKFIPEPNTGCFLWIAAVDRDGYGYFRLGRLKKAHRAAWELFHGPIPEGMGVLHRCDNSSCVNHEHLFLGTNEENSADRKRKGRQARGHRTLRAEHVHEIRRRRRAGETTRALGSAFGVSKTAICHILNGKNWAHLKESDQ